ncbi:MAG: hypothetical protein HYZ38_01650 [Mycobacterium sp.]|nr:hypothetical protein [Mycobacterium sp.]
MKADAAQQRSIRELAEVDAVLSRDAHRSANLDEQQRYQQVEAELQAAIDRVAVLGIALEDLEGQVSRLETEIDGVRQREDRDRALIDSPGTAAKQVAELSHELETLARRQSSLEDSLLEIMERREQLQAEQAREQVTVNDLRHGRDDARSARDRAVAELEQTRGEHSAQREQLAAALDADLLALYEKQRAVTGIGAGVLQGRRCGACRIEIDRGELARIAAADAEEILRCPECGAILLRVTP